MADSRDSITLPVPQLTSTIAFENFLALDEILCGIYVFRGKFGQCLYVGQTRSFRRRFYSHRRDSYFAPHIVTVDLYVINDPYIREIFETVFIDRMKPYYNRAKAFSKVRAWQDAIYFEIEAMEDDVRSLESELAEILEDASSDSLEESLSIDDDYSDHDVYHREALGACMRAIVRIPEIEAEISSLSSEIRQLYKKIST